MKGTRIALAAALSATLLVAAPTAGARPLLDLPTVQVHIESRIVKVDRARPIGQGLEPGLGSATVRCPPGEVALSGGYSTDVMGMSLVSSIPTGPRAWELSFANFTTSAVDVAGSVLCGEILNATRRLAVGTGKKKFMVPPGEVVGTGFVPGKATITGTCLRGWNPVSSGFDQAGSNGLSVTESFPSGARRLKVVVENSTLEEKPADVAIRCVDGPPGFSITLSIVPVLVPAATSEGGIVDPGEAEGSKRCGAGKVLAGGGYLLQQGVFAESFGPLLADVPILGYLFRNVSSSPKAQNKLVLFCTPRIIR
jgi:hypothetical protein